MMVVSFSHPATPAALGVRRLRRTVTIKPHVLADVVEALKRLALRAGDFREPFLAPTFDGFVQMEWHDKKRSLEVEAVDQGWSLVGIVGGDDGMQRYLTAECERSDFGKLESFYKWFILKTAVELPSGEFRPREPRIF